MVQFAIAVKPASLWSNALRKLHNAAQQIPMAATPATAHMFIVSPFSGGSAILSLFSTHPPMEKRIERLESLRLMQMIRSAGILPAPFASLPRRKLAR